MRSWATMDLDASPNAFATGRGPAHAAVACKLQGILEHAGTAMNCERVIAHELAHAAHRDILHQLWWLAALGAHVRHDAVAVPPGMFFGGLAPRCVDTVAARSA